MRRTLRSLALVFLSLFLLSTALINADNSENLLNNPRLFLSTRKRCVQTTPLPNDALFDRLDEEVMTPSLQRHNLARCPANAADLRATSPNDLNLLLNITDKQNQTNDHPGNESLEFNAERLDDKRSSGEKDDISTDQHTIKSSELTPEDTKKSAEMPQAPPPIATFEEWTKEKLMNKEKKQSVKDAQQNGPPTTEQKSTVQNGQPNNLNSINQEGSVVSPPSIQPNVNAQEPSIQSPPILTDPSTTTIPVSTSDITKRNYASKECGAKVLLANDEAEHRSAVLNDKERDEYMRNPCEKAQNKFLIIELCETIQPNFLEVANSELFSSGPKNIRMSISERYPTAEWILVGQFEAVDTREMQSFQFTSPGYAKFVKLDLLSHHRKEHYCTLTTVRISGVSMVDEYEAEAEGRTDTDSVPPSVVVQTPVEQQSVPAPSLDHAENQFVAPQKVESGQDPSNESDKLNEKKTFVLGKVVDIVGNLGQIKEVIGKTLLGAKRKIPRRMQSNSCSYHSSLINYDQLCLSKCHYFDLVDLPKRSASISSTSLTPRSVPAAIQSRAQHRFLFSVIPLSQCPTVIVETKKLGGVPEHKKSDVEQHPKPIEAPKEIVAEHSRAEELSPPIQQQNAQTPPAQQHQLFQPSKVPNSLPGTASTHKESVFMKLNKRLSALELNMSLSSEYLSELSRRYVAQQDGYNKQHERDLTILEEMVSRLGDNLKTAWIDEINQLRTEMNELSREIKHIKQSSRHIPSSFETASSSSLSLIDRSKRPFEENCYNMLLPSREAVMPDSEHTSSAWSNEQIAAIFTLSSLSAVTLFSCVYLLYKIFFRRRPIQSGGLSHDEIRALVQRELEQLRLSAQQEAGQTVQDIQADPDIQKAFTNTFTSSKRFKHRRQKHGLKLGASSTLSIPSTVATTSTSALDTMSSSASLSDIDQTEKRSPLIMELLNVATNGPREPERPASATPGILKMEFEPDSMQRQLSPPWQTVQNKRKLSDKTAPLSTKTHTKIKLN